MCDKPTEPTPDPAPIPECAYPTCPEPANMEVGYRMCDLHSGFLEFFNWSIKHFCFNGVSIADILTAITAPPPGVQGPGILGPDGIPLPARPPMGWNN